MENRRKPQPTDTALARFLTGIINRLPFVSRATFREMECIIADRDKKIAQLHADLRNHEDHIKHLYSDIKKMTHRVPPPTVHAVKLEQTIDGMCGELVRTIAVTYSEQIVRHRLEWTKRKRQDLSEFSYHGIRAIEQCAHAIAQVHAKTHAQYIIDATLGQGIFKP